MLIEDEILVAYWDKLENNSKVLNYVCRNKFRSLEGSHRLTLNLNKDRFFKKRKNQKIRSTNQELDLAEFNFTKVNSTEIIGIIYLKDSKICFELEHSSSTPTKYVHLLPNMFPTMKNHYLLVYTPENLINQKMNIDFLRISINYISCFKGSCFLGFNGLMAEASINHLHMHFLYGFKHMIADFYLTPICKEFPNLFYSKSHFANCFVCKYDGLVQTDENLKRLIDYLQINSVPHNIVVWKPEGSNSDIKIYIFPKLVPTVDESTSVVIYPACFDLIGLVTVASEENFNNLSETDIVSLIKPYCYDDPRMHHLVQEFAATLSTN